MNENFSTYQTADTAWRYEIYMSLAREAESKALGDLAAAVARLDKLRAHPPLDHLFNWSA